MQVTASAVRSVGIWGICPAQRHFVDSPNPTMIRPNPITMFQRPSEDMTGIPGAM